MSKSTGVLTGSTARRLKRLVLDSERRTGLRLSIEFVRGNGSSTPALVQLLRGENVDSGGRGGEVRLKLWLTLALLVAESPYVLREPRSANVWAQTIGLPDPAAHGARRVGDAIDWLHDHGFVVATRQRGKPAGLEVLYPEPDVPHRSGQGRWVVVPVELWKQGWIVTLSAAALVVLIQLIELTDAGSRPGAQSMDTLRRREYGISDDTWSRATRELEEAGLITTDLAVTELSYITRRRTTYRYLPGKLVEGPISKLGPLAT